MRQKAKYRVSVVTTLLRIPPERRTARQIWYILRRYYETEFQEHLTRSSGHCLQIIAARN
jgi:hypothetical protein